MMKGTIQKIFQVIKNRTGEREFIERHRRNKEDFTRNRNLDFEDVVNFVLGNTGLSLDFEVLKFSDERNQSVSAAALSKARDKVNFSAFYELFCETSKEIPIQKTYKGYRLKAYDGMIGELPKTKKLMLKYAAYGKEGYPQFHAVVEYDVLNCNYTDAIFEAGTMDEREAAYQLIERNDYTGAEIFLLDRGYPSLKIIKCLNEKGKKFVIRVSGSFLKEVNEFSKSKKNDETIYIEYGKERRRSNTAKNVELPYNFHLRCVKIKLKNGENEVLITNLESSEFSRKEIGELYNLRWKIEVGFLHLKYAVCVEDFVGVKENSIKQEFYGSLLKSNLFMQFVGISDSVICDRKAVKSNKKNGRTQL